MQGSGVLVFQKRRSIHLLQKIVEQFCLNTTPLEDCILKNRAPFDNFGELASNKQSHIFPLLLLPLGSSSDNNGSAVTIEWKRPLEKGWRGVGWGWQQQQQQHPWHATYQHKEEIFVSASAIS